MKILEVIPSYWPAFKFGGTIFSSHALNKALIRKGVDLTVYTTNVGLGNEVETGKEILVDGVRVSFFQFTNSLEWMGGTGWQFSLPMYKALKTNLADFDLVYIIGTWNYPVLAALRQCSYSHKPCILSPRGTLYPETFGKKFIKKSLYFNFVLKRYIKKISAMHYTTEDEFCYSHTRLGLKSQALVIPNGIGSFESDPLVSKEKLLQRYPNLRDKKIILFLGRLNWKKGLDILIEAFAMVAEKEANWHLLIVGNDENNYKNKIERLVISRGIKEKVSFLGIFTGEEKDSVYSASDIFVLPSYSENFGMTVVEAMSFGLPVIISDKVGIASKIKNEQAGLVVQAEKESLYEGLKMLIKNDLLRGQLRDKANIFVHRNYDINVIADDFIAAFKRIM